MPNPSQKNKSGATAMSLLISSVSIIILAEVWMLLGFKIPIPFFDTATLYASEIKYLEDNNLSFYELAKYFTKISNEEGAEYAYNLLKIAPIPPNTDMHLLGHVVSDELYKQKGSEGIKICTPDFRNACSHSIVVGLLLEKGDSAMDEISEACRLAPGGRGAYTMCFHGLGHGVLAYSDYDMQDAVELCATTGTKEYLQREYIECVGGTVMEIVGGGFHNQELWQKKSDEYLSVSDPLYLCSKEIMPEIAQAQCYTYLTPHLFKRAGGSLSNLTPDVYERAFVYCEGIPKSEASLRASCYGGFGKEFVVLAKARDVRQIGNMTDEELAKVYEWCSLAPHSEGINACINTSAASIFWGGENEPVAVIKFCSIVEDTSIQQECFANLFNSVKYYINDLAYLENFCAKVPNNYKGTCEEKLVN